MQQQPKAPEGFRDVQAQEPTGPRVDKEQLRSGVIVQYRATRRFPRGGQEGGTTVVHVFVSRAGDGKRFSVFGTAQLDSKLQNVKPESILWLLYAGKQTVDGQPTHVWIVSDAGLRLDAARIAELRRNSAAQDEELDRAIVAAESQQRARSQSGVAADTSYDEREFTDDEVPAGR